MGILNFLWTIVVFLFALLVSPLLVISYIFVQSFRWLWMYFLQSKYKNETDLEFIQTTSIRSLLDTSRNHAVFTFLMNIHGQCQPSLIRQTLFEIVGKRDKSGKLLYPHLQQTLVSIWGCYAWRRQENYQLDQNFIIGTPTFRGRALNESTLQEYLSTFVEKYIPPESSPWQVIVIPNSVGPNNDMYYILLRIHHMLLSEEKTLRISDLLMIKSTLMGDYVSPNDKESEISDEKSPLLDVFHAPQAIPNLYSKFMDIFSNYWNEFLAIYDPISNTNLFEKTTPNLFQLSAIILITVIAIIHDYTKNFHIISTDFNSRIKYLLTVTKRETQRRHIGLSLFLSSLFTTINPKSLALILCYTTYWLTVVCTARVPMYLYNEFISLYECYFQNYSTNQNTIVSFVYYYTPLLFSAAKEILYCAEVIINAPKTLINELVFSKFYASPQTIKLCGRKVISYTNKLNRNVIHTIAKNTFVTDTEVILSAIGAAITEFLETSNTPVPDQIPILARNIMKTYLYANNYDTKPKRNDIGGFVCLKLPLIKTELDRTKHLQLIHKDLNKARNNQQSLYALTKLHNNHGVLTNSFPSVVMKIVLNYLSRIYTITVTELLTELNEKKYKTTLWGSEIDNIVYWVPTQSNVSLSLCISCYADSITLAVMSDSLLSPAHVALVKEFTQSINRLVKELNIETEL